MRSATGYSLARNAACALGLALLGGVSALRAETLNVVSWDGAYVKSQVLGFIRPFEDATGHRVNIIQHSGGIEEIRQQVRAWNVNWDIVDMELFDAIRACKEGLLEPLDPAILAPAPDGTPATEDFIELDREACGAGNVVGSTVMSFRNDTFDSTPTRLEDFFDLDNFPGRRALRKSPMGNLEWALIADGVAPEKVYQVLSTEEGLERALRRLEVLKPHLQWWETGQEAIYMLESGQVAMSSVYSGRVAAARERGQPLEMIWDHQVWFYDVWAIPRNGRNTELAREFLRFATSTESLANQARYIPYGPMRRSSMAQLNPELRERLPTAEANMATALEVNARWWSEHLNRIGPRFARWVDRPVMVPKNLPR